MNNNILELPEDNQEETIKESGNKKASKIQYILVLIASSIISVFLLIMFFYAADLVKTGGLEIMSIESVGGKTLEEAYYQNLGYIYEGYCVALRAIGVFCSSVVLFIGVLRGKHDH